MRNSATGEGSSEAGTKGALNNYRPVLVNLRAPDASMASSDTAADPVNSGRRSSVDSMPCEQSDESVVTLFDVPDHGPEAPP